MTTRLALLGFATTFVCAGHIGAQSLRVEEKADTIEIRRGEVPVLTYHKAVVQPPAGQDPAFARSGFIHPLHTPAGGVVTGIHPADHIHHLGLWHAWVHGEHGGKEVDFWNLKGKTGAVRFRESAGVNQKDDSAAFAVKQEHVAFKDGKGGEPVVVLNEVLTVTARFADGANIIDYDIRQTNVTDQPLKLAAYRYGGGVAFRAPESWDKTNSDYLTSEGKTRKDSHSTRAKWLAATGPTEKGDATVAFLCHPSNHDAPQRLRTWDNGKIFLEYVPIQETAWEIKPKETITLRYRLVITDSKPAAAELESKWKAYAKE